MKRARNGKYVHTGVLEVVALELEYKAEEWLIFSVIILEPVAKIPIF
jgi:hypothetical protein